MAVLVDEDTRLVVQGLTGREGSFHSARNAAYGTSVVAGVTPGKGGTSVDGVPIFDSVASAVEETGANTSAIYVPAAHAPDAIFEAADAGVGLIICITEGIPALDLVKVAAHLERRPGARLVGPNCPGVISVGRANVGIIPHEICTPGTVGVVSRSGTLTYQVIAELTRAGLGQSTCIGIGGDAVTGTSFVDCLRLFERDPGTSAVVLIGEIGGEEEEEAARAIAAELKKPTVAYIAGFTAPPGKRMGHAGAIISGSSGTAASKAEALRSAGVPVAETPPDIPRMLSDAL